MAEAKRGKAVRKQEKGESAPIESQQSLKFEEKMVKHETEESEEVNEKEVSYDGSN